MLDLSASTENGIARAKSLDFMLAESPPSQVITYLSQGRLLIVGPSDKITEAGSLLESVMHCTLLAMVTSAESIQSSEERDSVDIYRADFAEIGGHLGRFSIQVSRDDKMIDLAKTIGIDTGFFDIVLDLNESPMIESEVPPPGYFATRGSKKHLRSAAKEIPDMVGSFEKPKYFSYDPDICAHGRSGLIGCTRCLDACPTDAISSLKETIEVDPHLCQGAGACATACPTGAITYDYPPPQSLLGSVRQMLKAYLEAGGASPTLLFYDRETGSRIVASSAATLPENVLPVEIEEIGSIGLDMFLCALAYGSASVAIVCHESVTPSAKRETEDQLSYLNALLKGAGHAPGAARLVTVSDPEALISALLDNTEGIAVEPAGFEPTGLKRTDMRLAIDHLYECGSGGSEMAKLPEGAPFGNVQVNQTTCTLCMACASVCPASAIEAGGDTPKLSFIEWNCVQCGLCETACPEDAVTRTPRFLFNADERMRSRTLNEDSPLHCLACGKPFATRAMISRMREKLKGHWMFEDPNAVKRLEMCDECRVKDMFANEDENPHF